MIYRPMRPKDLRKFLQAEVAGAAGAGDALDSTPALAAMVKALFYGSPHDIDDYVEIFLTEIFGAPSIDKLGGPQAWVLRSWMAWDDILEKSLSQASETLERPRTVAKREAHKFTRAVLKHRGDRRYLEFL